MTNAPVLFDEGFNCSQAVLAPRAESLGLPRETALRAAAGFGAGMGRLQDVCGAVTGAGMVLGLRYGHTEAGDLAGKDRVYALTRDLHRRFVLAHGTTKCRELLGVDMLTEDGRREMKERNLVATVCRTCVETADRIVGQILEENP